MSTRSGVRQERLFAFLRRLRAKGRSNMYGAVPYLMRAFELDRNAAFQAVCAYLDAQEQEAMRSPEVIARLSQRTSAPPSRRRSKGRARS
jgi:hypothetical protein